MAGMSVKVGRDPRAVGPGIAALGSRMTWDWTRILRGLALAAWGAFFVYLWASDSAEYAAANQITTGTEVEIVGFVSDTPPGGEIELSRFMVNCCAADGTAYSVTIKPPVDAPALEASTSGSASRASSRAYRVRA